MHRCMCVCMFAYNSKCVDHFQPNFVHVPCNPGTNTVGVILYYYPRGGVENLPIFTSGVNESDSIFTDSFCVYSQPLEIALNLGLWESLSSILTFNISVTL